MRFVANCCGSLGTFLNELAHVRQRLDDWPSLRIRGGVAEHVEEDGLGEGVELGEGGAALGPQRLRPVQHLRNPPLLGEGRERDLDSVRHVVWNVA